VTPLRILITAFLGGVILAACGRVVEPTCITEDIPVVNAAGDTVAVSSVEVCR